MLKYLAILIGMYVLLSISMLIWYSATNQVAEKTDTVFNLVTSISIVVCIGISKIRDDIQSLRKELKNGRNY